MFNDQVDYYRDMRHPWFWVPISIGVIITIVSFVIMYLSGKKGQKEEKKQQKLSPTLIAGLSLLGAGILLLVIPSVVLNIRHPAAFVEQEVISGFCLTTRMILSHNRSTVNLYW